MKTPYDILSVRRNASDETIRAAFRKAAKACHPDLNPRDRTAQQRLIQVIAAYSILKSPPHRAAYDQYLRQRRRERARRFAVDGVAALVGASVTSLAVWLWVSPSNTREASKQTPHVAAAMDSESANKQMARADDPGMHQDDDGGAAAPNGPLSAYLAWQLQQSAGSLQPAAGSPERPALLAKEWEQVEASGDPRAIWAFAVRNPDTPESVLAQSKLVALIDAAEDVALLQVLRLVATDAVAERAQQRLNQLSALAVAKEDSVTSGAPSSNPLQAALGETINPVIGEPRENSAASGAPSSNPPRQAAFGETIKPVIGEPREDDVASGAPSSNPPLQAALGETMKPVIGEPREDSVVSDAPSSNPPLQAALVETIKPVIREPRKDDVTSGAPSSNPPLQAALGETNKPVIGEPREDNVVSDTPSSNPPLQAALGETIKPVIGEQSAPALKPEQAASTRKRESPAAQKTVGRPRIIGKRQTTKQPPVKQASSENRSMSAKQVSSEDRRTSACAAYESCSGSRSSSGPVAPLFGVGF